MSFSFLLSNNVPLLVSGIKRAQPFLAGMSSFISDALAKAEAFAGSSASSLASILFRREGGRLLSSPDFLNQM